MTAKKTRSTKQNKVEKSESSDDTTYGPSIAYYHSILEQKQYNFYNI